MYEYQLVSLPARDPHNFSVVARNILRMEFLAKLNALGKEGWQVVSDFTEISGETEFLLMRQISDDD